MEKTAPVPEWKEKAVYKLQQELLRQNYKDRRAYVEIVSKSQSDIVALHVGSAKRRNIGLFETQTKVNAELVRSANITIKLAEKKIKALDIIIAEREEALLL